MLKSLKKIVIILGILIILLTTFITITLFKRMSSVDSRNSGISPENYFKLESRFKIQDFSVDEGKIYFYLTFKDRKIIRIYEINNGNFIKEYQLN